MSCHSPHESRKLSHFLVQCGFPFPDEVIWNSAGVRWSNRATQGYLNPLYNGRKEHRRCRGEHGSLFWVEGCINGFLSRTEVFIPSPRAVLEMQWGERLA
jgi:hypothetical protein